MTKPNESDYTSHVAYTRALESYCEVIEAELDKLDNQEPVAHIEMQYMVGAKFHENCNWGCDLKEGDKLFLAAGASK